MASRKIPFRNRQPCSAPFCNSFQQHATAVKACCGGPAPRVNARAGLAPLWSVDQVPKARRQIDIRRSRVCMVSDPLRMTLPIRHATRRSGNRC
jgi:hypothetical protein